MGERVTIDRKEGVAHVRMNRPEKLNALDQAMFDGLIAAGQELAQDASVRAVVLSGEGRAFCAGLDFGGFQAMSGGGEQQSSDGRPARGLLSRNRESPANHAQSAAWIWAELPVPAIAAIHGVAYGGGLQVALGADIRLVSPDARLSVMEIKWGLIPDMSGTQTLRRLVRLDVLKELTFTGRVISGSEAVELGLATRVSPDPLEASLELAREIASKSPDAIRAGKQLLQSSGLVDTAEGLALEAKVQASLIGRPNQIESVRANMEKRDPRFSDPE